MCLCLNSLFPEKDKSVSSLCLSLHNIFCQDEGRELTVTWACVYTNTILKGLENIQKAI